MVHAANSFAMEAHGHAKTRKTNTHTWGFRFSFWATNCPHTDAHTTHTFTHKHTHSHPKPSRTMVCPLCTCLCVCVYVLCVPRACLCVSANDNRFCALSRTTRSSPVCKFAYYVCVCLQGLGEGFVKVFFFTPAHPHPLGTHKAHTRGSFRTIKCCSTAQGAKPAR